MNFCKKGFNGIAIRKDILDHYLQDEKLVLIYYISGENSCMTDIINPEVQDTIYLVAFL